MIWNSASPAFAPPVPGNSLDIAPAGTYAELRDGSGTKLASTTIGFGEQAATEPRLPKQTSPQLRPGQRRLFTAPAVKGSTEYRVLAEASSENDTVLLLAIPLREVTSTLHRLVFVEILVTVGVLALVVIIALWLVRLSLRPLDKMTLTAGEIAAGNLSARVEDEDAHGEVGRLGRALNAMLHQIEQAFSDRQRSEDQLRHSEERLRRFVADASHELRTPLTSIRGHSELFRRGADADPVALAQSMRRIEEEAARMGVLVDDLLLLARLDEGRPPDRERVDFTKVVQDAVTVMPVPGAFELPLAAMALAKTRRYACVVALGCVIRGETPHFEYVAGEAASGLQLAALETGVPVAFGVLTVDVVEQAEARISKGAEAVRTALEMADAFAQLRATAR